MTRFAVVIFFAALAAASAIEIPEFIRVCKKNDPQLDKCITDSVEHLRPYLNKGVPEYHLPSLEPLLLKELVASQGTGIKITATNVHAYGASDFIVKRVKVDVDALDFNVDIDLPHLYVDGDYEIEGRVLLLPITGSGPMRGNFTACTGVVNFVGELVKDADGVDHLHVKDFHLKITIGNGNLRLENLFGGERILGDVVNNAINSNFEAFSRELLPLIEKALSEAFLEIGNSIVGPFTFKQLFPDD